MEPVRQGRGAGFIGVGIAFMALGMGGDHPALPGMGLVFFVLGIGARHRGTTR